MKRIRIIALVLMAIFLMPLYVGNARSLETSPRGVVRTATARNLTIPLLAITDVYPLAEPLSLPVANPVHHIELTATSIQITYPDGTSSGHGRDYIPLIINGNVMNESAIMINNQTLAPLRTITETLGGTAYWDPDTQSITIIKDDDEINMTIGSDIVTINGNQSTLDVPPTVYNGSTFLPIRFVADALGANVSFNTGGYDPTTMTFDSYMLVQGVSGNAVIDQIDPAWPMISEFQAESIIMSMSRDLFNQFRDRNNAANPYRNFTAVYNFIEYSIENTRLIGSVSRYYVIESFALFLFDKYTGIVYTIGNDRTSNWIRQFESNNPQNYELFSKFFHGQDMQ